MTDKLRIHCSTGPYKRYCSYYKWTLHDWSLINDASPKIGATSMNFDLNGTPGYTCHFSLCFSKYGWEFFIDFSDTLGIGIVIIAVRLNTDFVTQMKEHKPIPTHLKYNLGARMYPCYEDDIFESVPSVPSELVIEIDITIFRESELMSCLNPTEVPPMMFSTSNSAPPITSAELKTMFEQKTLCDVTFVLGDKIFYAHKIVLAAQSTVFKAMFLSGMKEQTTNVIDITTTTPDVFQQFLNYFYSGEITELENVVEEMILMADFYNVSHLKIMCENFMLQSLSEKSAIRYVILADKLKCDTLKNRALSIIRNKASGLERAILEEEFATLMCLKEILSDNQPKEQAEPIVS